MHNSYALGLRHFAEHTVYESEHMPSADGGMQIGVRIVTSDHFNPSAAAAAPAAEGLPLQPDGCAFLKRGKRDAGAACNRSTHVTRYLS